MKLAQLILEGLTYRVPNFDYEWEEAVRYPEFKKLGKHDWIDLATKGREVTITSAKDINNTDANKPDSFKKLNKDKQKRTLAQIESGTVEMPIVAKYPDGYKELLGGNTRLTALMAKNGKATIWMFDVPEDILDESSTNAIKNQMKLSSIILENEFETKDDIDLSILGNLDDEIRRELEKSSKELEKLQQQNEIGILTLSAVTLGAPGVVKAIDKLVQSIAKKNGFDLIKKDPGTLQKAYNSVVKTAEKADSLIEKPINFILRPFVKDDEKRKKIAGFVKGAVLLLMALYGGINPSNITDIKSAITSAAPEVADELLGIENQANAGAKLVTIARKYFQS